ESLQQTGSFKLRGAVNKLLCAERTPAGVVAHSSGNHAQAVARAARLKEIPAVVVMPWDAPRNKRHGVEADGAELVLVGIDSDERTQRARELADEKGFLLIEPYDDLDVAAGQGTAALELLEDTGQFERFYAPVSGGGLMAGCSTVLRALRPSVEIVGCEPEGADDTRQSLEEGRRVTIDPPSTIADGLRVRRPGSVTWPVIKENVDRIEVVNDAEMISAMGFALRELRVVLEPSGAAALALARREASGRSAVLLSGGNVEGDLLVAAAAAELETA
ncbi:MAG: threonine/serine dehydratase, partial [Myxococcota bacterium]|nr:threonine/serine dehydratase [Myxococcota bacterium]